jgi:3-oxoacyl-[acyl-carrier protein] reductase
MGLFSLFWFGARVRLAPLPRWHDLASDGITVNCVVPGLIGTPRPKDRPEPARHLSHGTITGERGKPDDVAAMVRFLCSPAARTITGQAIHANGGAYLGA